MLRVSRDQLEYIRKPRKAGLVSEEVTSDVVEVAEDSCARVCQAREPVDFVAWRHVVDDQDDLAAQEEGEGQVEFEDVADDADLGPVQLVLSAKEVQQLVVLAAARVDPAVIVGFFEQLDALGDASGIVSDEEFLGICAKRNAARVHAHDFEFVLNALGPCIGHDAGVEVAALGECGEKLDSA